MLGTLLMFLSSKFVTWNLDLLYRLVLLKQKMFSTFNCPKKLVLKGASHEWPFRLTLNEYIWFLQPNASISSWKNWLVIWKLKWSSDKLFVILTDTSRLQWRFTLKCSSTKMIYNMSLIMDWIHNFLWNSDHYHSICRGQWCPQVGRDTFPNQVQQKICHLLS